MEMAGSQNKVLIVIADPQVSLALERVVKSGGFTGTVFYDSTGALRQASMNEAVLAVVGDQANGTSAIDTAAVFLRRFPSLPVILFAARETPDLFKDALRMGIQDVIFPPIRAETILHAVREVIERTRRRKDAVLLDSRRITSMLQSQVSELETLTRLGHQVTGSLDIDHVLTAIVDAAVNLTGAEEGSLLLIDDETGELYMRAARNFQEDFVRTFRLPITDSLAGAVIRSGEAVLMDDSTPQKIKTSYLVQSILYVPLQRQGHVLGVLGVDNRHSHLPLTQRHVALLNALSSSAVSALENARLYAAAQAEREKLEIILTNIQDGVLAVDHDQRVALVNQSAADALGLANPTSMLGKLFSDTIPQAELANLLDMPEGSPSDRTEISPDENHVFSVQVTPISGVGKVFTLHDITYLKKLDRIKTDFVHTVSHDLRSPLTAILGYVELLERIGPINDQQRDFIHRIQNNVHNITHLVDNLLELGRIESHVDLHEENVFLDQITRYSVEAWRKRIAEKDLHIQIHFPPQWPGIQANPVQIRQMVEHLLDNAIKYTPSGGQITITGQVEQNQAILRVRDTGMGIPAMDLPYIFDKFYRAPNANASAAGTGLGLAIVKSVVENHGGRVWVESTLGEGTISTVVLPLSE